MQAYHQQIANLALPNGGGTPGLLVATSHHNQQQHHLLQQQSHNTYQELVKAYLPQITGQLSHNTTCNGNMTMGSNTATAGSPSMTSFAVRLMSLNAHELRCLSSDSELMRHIDKAHALIENRLRDINSPEHFASSATETITTNGSHTQKIHLQQQTHHQMFAPTNQSNQMSFALQHHHHHPHNEHLMLGSPDNYYQNFYAQQLASNQQQQQANQLLLMASRYHHDANNTLGVTNGLAGNSTVQQQQQHLAANQTTNNQATPTSTTNTVTSSSMDELNIALQTAIINNGNQNQQLQQQQQHHAHAAQNGLDLRTTPRPASALSTTPSPSRAGSTGSGNSRYAGAQQHPKKLKLTEYRRLQLLAEQATQQKHIRQYSNNTSSDGNHDVASTLVSEPDENNPHLETGCGVGGVTLQASPGCKRSYQGEELALAAAAANTRSCQQKVAACGLVMGGGVGGTGTHVPSLGVKKYKGEFDEPTLEEVAQRERDLHKPGHYHKMALKNGECACVIGSEFRDKTRMEALELLERWRSLEVEERVKWKWDVNDLPKDIPLSDIKKFEDLRRDYSRGRADFGGASKRKPLSIRGTRQFLLMLYCLHGHPGREDIMQKEGYCPHCLAKIRTENEQSTLVRVVNHFNMKHRRGANPRLSPHLETAQRTPALGSPALSPTPIRETLISMVESAVASVETTGDKIAKADDKDCSPPSTDPAESKAQGENNNNSNHKQENDQAQEAGDNK